MYRIHIICFMAHVCEKINEICDGDMLSSFIIGRNQNFHCKIQLLLLLSDHRRLSLYADDVQSELEVTCSCRPGYKLIQSQCVYVAGDCAVANGGCSVHATCATTGSDQQLWLSGTRKPCCRKETVRCRSCCFWYKVRRQHSLQV